MKITTVGVCIICGIFPLLVLPQIAWDINPCVSDCLRLRTGIYPLLKGRPLYRADVAVFSFGAYQRQSKFCGQEKP